MSTTTEDKKILPHVYNVNIQWSESTKGVMCSPELKDAPSGSGCIEVATPPEFPRGIPGIWSPEHLFTASVSSCLMTTFLAIAANSNLEFGSFKCGAKGTLNKTERGFQMTEIHLYPTVTVFKDSDEGRCQRILEKAEQHCLISNSITSTVHMEPTIQVVDR